MNQNLQAVGWILLTGFLTISIITLGKFLTEDFNYHAFQLVFFYNFLALIFFVPGMMRGRFSIGTTRMKMYTARAILEFSAFSLTFYGLTLMPLPVHTTISFIAPLLGSITAVIFLKEKNHIHRWLALAIGFAGVVIVAQPGARDFELPALVMVGAAMCFAMCDVCIKKLTYTEPPPRIAFYMVSLTSMIALGVILIISVIDASMPGVVPFTVWTTPDLGQIPYLALLGLMVAAVQYAVSKAFSKGDVTLILPFFFVNIIWSSLYAYFLFDELIERETIIGGAVIIGATLYVAHHARRQGQSAKAHAAEAPLPVVAPEQDETSTAPSQAAR